MSYVWFDTGIEYRATVEHLGYLEDRYGVRILRRRAEKTIPVSCREYGQPFVSKYASEQVMRLQRGGFRFEDGGYEELVARYPDCTSALKWWCDAWTRTDTPGFFDIGRNHLLREFMVEHPPGFRISNKCCTYAKKRVSDKAMSELGADLLVTGVRAAEKGIRQAQRGYRSSCVTHGKDGRDSYRPLYWMSNADRDEYVRTHGVRHSDCYEVWGFKRTGCVGCPFNRNVLAELGVARRYEPGLVALAERVFADSYAYPRQYREYQMTHRRLHGGVREAEGQMSLPGMESD